MNNEEKILKILSEMQDDLQGIKAEQQEMKADLQDVKAEQQEMKVDLQGMKAEQQEMKADLQGMKAEQQEMKADLQSVKAEQQGMKAEQLSTNQRLDRIEQEVRKTSIIIENEIQPNIKLLAEGHGGIIQRLDKIEDKVSEIDDIKSTVAVLKLISVKNKQWPANK